MGVLAPRARRVRLMLYAYASIRRLIRGEQEVKVNVEIVKLGGGINALIRYFLFHPPKYIITAFP